MMMMMMMLVMMMVVSGTMTMAMTMTMMMLMMVVLMVVMMTMTMRMTMTMTMRMTICFAGWVHCEGVQVVYRAIAVRRHRVRILIAQSDPTAGALRASQVSSFPS